MLFFKKEGRLRRQEHRRDEKCFRKKLAEAMKRCPSGDVDTIRELVEEADTKGFRSIAIDEERFRKKLAEAMKRSPSGDVDTVRELVEEATTKGFRSFAIDRATTVVAKQDQQEKIFAFFTSLPGAVVDYVSTTSLDAAEGIVFSRRPVSDLEASSFFTIANRCDLVESTPAEVAIPMDEALQIADSCGACQPRRSSSLNAGVAPSTASFATTSPRRS
ncbi:hypothetical protein Esi_0270_0049 [Ectocarpus siliculosus]|uniref:Uncharacterized protein n=1 Tax=Ectocarpus siliculosus TaxID=2880 RepID=D7FUJ8_ECTSI|nr:hypothetical protein Esi_0270_0049 [Ectocarpus siliculosus]|eukprot:CBJ31654.1 hypothetical protein Esi_0270_0049 [Ectocarpus siliculosus]